MHSLFPAVKCLFSQQKRIVVNFPETRQLIYHCLSIGKAMRQSENEPSTMQITNAIKAAQNIVTRSSTTNLNRKTISTPKSTTQVNKVRKSDRIHAKTGRQKSKLTVKERTERAKSIIRMMEEKD